MLDPENLFPYSIVPISKELSSIFDTIGVGIQLRRESESVAAVMPGELVIVLSNHQTSGWLSKHHIRDRILGSVMNSNSPKRTIFIYVQNIARLLNLRWAKMPTISSGKNAELARAIARVIGHELIHAVVPDHSHTSSGLMQSSLTRDDLVAGDLRLDEGCATAFLSELAGKSERMNVAEDENMRPSIPTAAGDSDSID
jgi:hypothetical protein